jgi:hypothetical protein
MSPYVPRTGGYCQGHFQEPLVGRIEIQRSATGVITHQKLYHEPYQHCKPCENKWRTLGFTQLRKQDLKFMNAYGASHNILKLIKLSVAMSSYILSFCALYIMFSPFGLMPFYAMKSKVGVMDTATQPEHRLSQLGLQVCGAISGAWAYIYRHWVVQGSMQDISWLEASLLIR